MIKSYNNPSLRTRITRMIRPIITLGSNRGVFVQQFGRYYAHIYNFRQIDGFLEDIEAVKLYDIAHQLPDKNVVIVELGSWVGKSSMIMSVALRNKENSFVYCIDPFDGSGDEFSLPEYRMRQREMGTRLIDVFSTNMENYGHVQSIKTMQGYSTDLVQNWTTPIDFLFVDANHEYEAVRRDLREWSPYILSGGWIGIHDVRIMKDTLDLSDPAKAVLELIHNSENWTEKNLVGSLYVAKKR